MARASGSTEESGGGPVDAIDIMHDVVDDSALTAFSRRVGVWEHGAVFSGVHQHLIEQVLVPGTGVWTLRRALEEHLAVASPLEEGAGASVAGGGDGEGGAAADTPTPTPHVAAVAAVAAPPGTVPADAEAPSPGVHSPTLSVMPRTELVALQQGLAELCQPHTGSIETFLTETLADAVASLRACQVLPTRHDASDGGVGTSSHGPHAASTTDAPSSAGHQRFVALVRPMVRLVEALTCVASLCVSSARLVQVLEPLDEHSSFWKGRAEWPARDLLEAGPRWWWAAARRAVAAHRGGDAPSGDASRTRDSPSRRGVVGRSTTPTVATAATATSSGARRRRVGGAGGGQGAGASWRGAGNKRTSPTWYSAFDPTPAAVAKVKGIEQLRKPVLFRLGIVQRSLLAFRSATSASSIGVAVTRAVATLREVMLPPNAPRPCTACVVDDLFALLAIQEDTDGVLHVTGTAWLEEKCRVGVRPHKKRTYWERNWWRITAVGITSAVVGWKMYRNRKDLGEWKNAAGQALHEFVTEHLVNPSKAIYDELFRSETLHVANEAALQDATLSLRTMLGDFAKKSSPQLSEAQIQDVMHTLDISFVSRKYEAEIQRPVRNAVLGDLVQMMLIQIQSIKHELMVAMEAVDQLLLENQFNLQVMATIPAFMVFYGSMLAVRGVYRKVTRPTSTRDLRRLMRITLRDVDRLLTLSGGSPHDDVASQVSRRFSQVACQSWVTCGRHVGSRRPGPGSLHSGGDSPNTAHTAVQFRGLSPSELGNLVYLVIQFKKLVDRYRSYAVMSLSEWVRLSEDLRDLACWELSPKQRSQTLARMRTTHGFLLPERPGDSKGFL